MIFLVEIIKELSLYFLITDAPIKIRKAFRSMDLKIQRSAVERDHTFNCKLKKNNLLIKFHKFIHIHSEDKLRINSERFLSKWNALVYSLSRNCCSNRNQCRTAALDHGHGSNVFGIVLVQDVCKCCPTLTTVAGT